MIHLHRTVMAVDIGVSEQPDCSCSSFMKWFSISSRLVNLLMKSFSFQETVKVDFSLSLQLSYIVLHVKGEEISVLCLIS